MVLALFEGDKDKIVIEHCEKFFEKICIPTNHDVQSWLDAFVECGSKKDPIHLQVSFQWKNGERIMYNTLAEVYVGRKS